MQIGCWPACLWRSLESCEMQIRKFRSKNGISQKLIDITDNRVAPKMYTQTHQMWANKRRDTISYDTGDGIIKWANESPHTHRHAHFIRMLPHFRFNSIFDHSVLITDHVMRQFYGRSSTRSIGNCASIFTARKIRRSTGAGRATDSTSAVIFASLLQSSAMRHERCVRFECYTLYFFSFFSTDTKWH